MLGRPLMSFEICDHINGDRLDNRRGNLRITNYKGNAENRHDRLFRGASFHKKLGKWTARVSHHNAGIHVGYFLSQREAADAAAAKRKELGFLDCASGFAFP